MNLLSLLLFIVRFIKMNLLLYIYFIVRFIQLFYSKIHTSIQSEGGGKHSEHTHTGTYVGIGYKHSITYISSMKMNIAVQCMLLLLMSVYIAVQCMLLFVCEKVTNTCVCVCVHACVCVCVCPLP
jgi:hypothetical protein